MNKSTKSLLYCALAFYFFATRVSGVIDCHYCGIRKLCTLPYDDSFSEKISCAKSCMKFDGFAEDGKRVLVRSCGFEDTNTCNKTIQWHGSKGEKCICNAENCNSSNSKYSNLSIFAQLITLLFSKIFTSSIY